VGRWDHSREQVPNQPETCSLEGLDRCDAAAAKNQFWLLPLQQLLALLVQLLPNPMSTAGAAIFWRARIACIAFTSFHSTRPRGLTTSPRSLICLMKKGNLHSTIRQHKKRRN
jgi:hypothetical protein